MSWSLLAGGLVLVLGMVACAPEGSFTPAPMPAAPILVDQVTLTLPEPAPAPPAPNPPAPAVAPAAPPPPARPAQPVAARHRQTLPFNAPRAEGHGDQCTAYVLDRMHAATGMWMRSSGHAGEWGRTARDAGWTVGVTPAAQSIVVMPYAGGFQYATFAGGAHARAAVHPEHGHVGWVERLDATGNWALVSDQNWDGAGARGARWLWIKQTPAQFIYSDR